MIYGDETMELELGASWNNSGRYRSYFFPNATGEYTFHIYGTLDGVEIDETFTSGPETFSTVESIEPL